ncbi:MAG TPA: PadR family transcriptional regulator [Gemmatimonadaceae bacterium]|jgi:transcriptional regulator
MTEPLAVAKGTLDMIVLRALSWAPMHGFEIVEWVETHATNAIEVTDAAVYQSLYRMEQRGLVAATWGLTANNRRARYYKVTAEGNAYFRAESRRWMRYAETVTELLTAPLAAKPRRDA